MWNQGGQPRLWVIVIAGLLAFMLLYGAVGPRAAVGLIAAAAVGWFLYQSMRSRTQRGVRCLRCGEILPATARQCKYCGSASWTYN